MKIYNENKVRIRITNVCNSNCVFCLEGDINKKRHIESKRIKKKINKMFDKGMKNRLMLSGGEASNNPKLPEYIRYGKKQNYHKIQTITNGIKWADLSFCKKCVEAGLDEITFSIHGYNSKTHDYQTGIEGSFKKLIKSIHNFKSNFPNIIVNSDIVISKYNIKFIPKIIKLLQKFDIYEYDILQIIPFGKAWENRDNLLFKNIFQHYYDFQKIWSYSKDKRVHMWANRVNPKLLEGYEELIQNPEKIKDEVAGENKELNKKAFNQKKTFHCQNKIRCKSCYLKDFCKKLKEYYNSKNNIKKIDKKSYKLFSDKKLFKINKKYPEDMNDFLIYIQKKTKNKNTVINIPYCILKKNNYFTQFKDFEGKKTWTNYIKWYENEGFRVKSYKCKKCKYNNICDGIHINIIKKYGFKLLSIK